MSHRLSTAILSNVDQEIVIGSFQKVFQAMRQEQESGDITLERTQYFKWKMAKSRKELIHLIEQTRFFSEENQQILIRYRQEIDSFLARKLPINPIRQNNRVNIGVRFINSAVIRLITKNAA